MEVGAFITKTEANWNLHLEWIRAEPVVPTVVQENGVGICQTQQVTLIDRSIRPADNTFTKQSKQHCACRRKTWLTCHISSQDLRFFLVRFRETERLKERWKTKSKFGSSAAHEVRCLFKLFSDRLLLSFRVNLTWQTLSAGDRRPGNTDVSSRLEGRWQTARPWWAPIGPVVDCGEALTSQSLYLFIYFFQCEDVS